MIMVFLITLGLMVQVANFTNNDSISMDDQESKCLQRCMRIDDMEKRWNCILQCPTTKETELMS